MGMNYPSISGNGVEDLLFVRTKENILKQQKVSKRAVKQKTVL